MIYVGERVALGFLVFCGFVIGWIVVVLAPVILSLQLSSTMLPSGGLLHLFPGYPHDVEQGVSVRQTP